MVEADTQTNAFAVHLFASRYNIPILYKRICSLRGGYLKMENGYQVSLSSEKLDGLIQIISSPKKQVLK